VPGFVCIRVFPSRLEAEMARGLLESFGVRSWIRADDAGGVYPFQLSGRGVQLMVEDRSAEQVRRLLAAGDGGAEATTTRGEAQAAPAAEGNDAAERAGQRGAT
jgi:hypothetical protein